MYADAQTGRTSNVTLRAQQHCQRGLRSEIAVRAAITSVIGANGAPLYCSCTPTSRGLSHGHTHY
jgi:hypothetical protein